MDDVADTVALCLGRRAGARDLGSRASAGAHARRDRRGDPALARISAAAGAAASARGWASRRRRRRRARLARLAQPRALDRDRAAHGRRGRRSGAPGWPRPGSNRRASTRSSRRIPASVQERWFARLYLFKPLAIVALALFWIATGMIALGPGRAAASAHLTRLASRRRPADPPVAGALFDIVLGASAAGAPARAPVLITMLAVTPIYLIVGTVLAPAAVGRSARAVPEDHSDAGGDPVHPGDPRRAMTEPRPRAQAHPRARRGGAVRHRARHRLLHVDGASHAAIRPRSRRRRASW